MPDMKIQLTGDRTKDYRLLMEAVYQELDDRIGDTAGPRQGRGSFKNVDVQHHLATEDGTLEFLIRMIDGRAKIGPPRRVLFEDWCSYPDPSTIVTTILKAYENLRDEWPSHG